MVHVKISSILSICILLLSQIADIVLAAGGFKNWGYEGASGPSTWPSKYSTCSGTAQSPVDIKTADVIYNQKNLKPFKLKKEKPSSDRYKMVNDGHKAMVLFTDVWKATFEGDDSCFQPRQIHWHWGSSNSMGSEHTINNKAYPLEMHLVMFNCKDYKDPKNAVGRPNGLAVMGVFYEVDDSAPTEPTFNSIISNFNKTDFRKCSCTTKDDIPALYIPQFNISKVLPDNMKDFYRYMGSLTTPPCSQNVMWTVFKQTKKITSKQMQMFRQLQYPDATPMVNNFRPPLPLNPDSPITTLRQISASFNGSPAQISNPNILTLLLMSIFVWRLSV